MKKIAFDPPGFGCSFESFDEKECNNVEDLDIIVAVTVYRVGISVGISYLIFQKKLMMSVVCSHCIQ